jgi:hypothetical protein
MESLGVYLFAGAFCLMALRSKGPSKSLSVTMTIYWITFHMEDEIVGGKSWNGSLQRTYRRNRPKLLPMVV